MTEIQLYLELNDEEIKEYTKIQEAYETYCKNCKDNISSERGYIIFDNESNKWIDPFKN